MRKIAMQHISIVDGGLIIIRIVKNVLQSINN